MSRRIHRRRNEQIQKTFVCEQGCGKAYGSFAALFTHIHKKHPQAHPPQMRSQPRQPTGRVGRPVQVISPLLDIIDCKVCNKSPCVCPQHFQQIDFLVEVMADDRFINLTNAVGSLTTDNFTFVRNTEQDFSFRTPLDIEDIVRRVNTHIEEDGLKVISNARLNTFLSVCSRYWVPEHMSMLYQAILVTTAFKLWSACEHYFKENQMKFARINTLLHLKAKQFEQLFDIIKTIR